MLLQLNLFSSFQLKQVKEFLNGFKMNQFSFSILLLFLAVLSWTSVVGGERINYSGYKIARVFPENGEQWKQIKALERLGVYLNFDCII